MQITFHGAAGCVTGFCARLQTDQATQREDDLTIWNAASTHYTLKVMTIVALIFTPIVLIYQGWTYWVFRKRIRRADVEASEEGTGGAEAPSPA